MKYLIPFLFVLGACSDFDVPNGSFPGSNLDYHIVNYCYPEPQDHCVVMDAADKSRIRLCNVNPYYVQSTSTLEVPAGTSCIAVFAQDQQSKKCPTIIEDMVCEDHEP